jgi:pyruvate dehydrogenase E1 component alpha subunit
VFVCENNEWAISTPVRAATRIENIADRASAYGFPGVVADGNDVLAMRAAAAEAVERARSGAGPTLIEAKSYRVTPHSAATKTDLRPPDELDHWKRRDPILALSRRLAEEFGATEERLAELEERARQDVEEAVEFALASPRPEPAEAIEDVYAPSEWMAPGRLS